MGPTEKPAKPGHHLVPCDGEAHRNPHIDNCLTCAPRWGFVEIPVEYPTLAEYLTRDE